MKISVNPGSLRAKILIFSLAMMVLITGSGLLFAGQVKADAAEEAGEEDKEQVQVSEINFIEHQAENFIVHYPEDWQLDTQKDDTGEVVVFSKDMSGYPNINVLQQENVAMTVEEYLELSLEQMEEFEGFELKETKDIELAETEARQIEFTHDEIHQTLRQRQIMTVHEEKAYVLTYTDFAGNFSEHLPLYTYLVENKFRIRENAD